MELYELKLISEGCDVEYLENVNESCMNEAFVRLMLNHLKLNMDLKLNQLKNFFKKVISFAKLNLMKQLRNMIKLLKF